MSQVPTEMQQNPTRPAAAEADVEGDEDWDVISLPDTDADGRPRKQNVYIDFQLTTWIGTMSLRVSRSAAKNGCARELPSGDGTPTNEQSQSPLFRLPIELRLCMYEHLMRIYSSDSGVMLRRCPRATPTPSTVLLTCRRVLAEAEDIFYSINRLYIGNLELADTLGSRRRKAITKVTLHVDKPAYALYILQMFQKFPNLRSIRMLRRMSIRFMDISAWAVMVPQLAAEIRKMKALEDLQIITAQADNLLEHERARQTKLEQKDQMLYDAVQRAPTASRRT